MLISPRTSPGDNLLIKHEISDEQQQIATQQKSRVVDGSGVARIRILWTANIVLPKAAASFGLASVSSGGWLTEMLNELASLPEFHICVAMLAPVKQLKHVEIDGIEYFAIPRVANSISDSDSAKGYADAVLKSFSPDILHANGSEMPFTRLFMALFEGPRVLSLQGVVSGIAPFQLGGLPISSMISNPLRPRHVLIASALLFNRHFRFERRVRAEKQIFRMADYVLGRTLWDRAHSYALNPRAIYFHCGEILRSEFFEHQWRIENCERQTIFFGNSYVALKGAHMAIRALSKIHLKYPEARLLIAGQDTRRLSRFSLQRLCGYQAYIFSLIKELNLEKHVSFLGNLDAREMVKKMCKAHVFLLSSFIENSPNTLAEAMLLGLPSVAAYVGGVPSMVDDECEALLYRAEDLEMLVFQVQRLFDNDVLSLKLSRQARIRAQRSHDKKVNLDALVAAYAAASASVAHKFEE